MLKALVVGNSSLHCEIMSRFKNLFDFVPLISITEQGGSIVANNLIENININNIDYLNLPSLLSDFDIVIITSEISKELEKILKEIKSNSIFISKINTLFESSTNNIIQLGLNCEKDIDITLPIQFICTVLNGLRTAGFKINIITNVAEYKNLLSVIKKYNEPDFTISITNDPVPDNSYSINHYNCNNEISRALVYMKSVCRQKVNKEDYIERDIELYSSFDNQNIHLFHIDKKSYLFKSCEQSYISISQEYESMISAYYKKDVSFLVDNISYELLENFSQLREWERQKEKEFSTLVKSKYVTITNINDVILSYLGARKCNLNCKYCFSDHKKKECPELCRNEVTQIANHIIKGNKNINLHVDNYIGGEPTVDFKSFQNMHTILTSYHKAFNLKTSFGFLTNGIKITEEQLIWLKNNNPYVGFSLDGDQVTNDNIRIDNTKKSTYKKTVKSIKMLRSLDWPIDIGISCVITAGNLNIKKLFLHFIKKLNIHNIVIKPVRAPEQAEFALTINNIELLKKGYTELFDFIYKKAKKGDISYLKSMLMPLDYAGRFFIRTFLGNRVIVKRCGAGEHIFSVGNDACIYPCDSFNGTKEVIIADIRNNEYYDNFKVPYVTQIDNNFNCKNCWARYLCGGVCQYVQYVNNYELNSVTKLECELAMFLIKEAIEFWIKGRQEFNQEIINEIQEHISKIGFDSHKKCHSLFYAPC